MPKTKSLPETITAIAEKHLDIGHLEAIGSDREDFREVYVNNLRRALEDAFNAGMKHGISYGAFAERALEIAGAR